MEEDCMLILNTKGIIDYTEKTILGAKSRLIIVSPYVDIKESILRLIESKCKEGVKVMIVCGKTLLKETELVKILNFENCELYYNHYVHAKIILNDYYGIISSMNLYEASEKNYEVGVLLSENYDKKEFDALEIEFNRILRNSEQYRVDLTK